MRVRTIIFKSRHKSIYHKVNFFHIIFNGDMIRMSGIFGVVSLKLNKKKAVESLKTLSHRGKFEEVYFNKHIFLGNRQISETNQPIKFNEFIISFDGKIYNLEKLKKGLQQKGYVFTSDSDAEVVVKLFAEHKENVAKMLDGMFAFVIWDEKRECFFACRDHLGQKPFFYYHCDNEFVFASEIKAIIHYKNINLISINSLQEVLGLGPSRTPSHGIYTNVHELIGGHYLVFEKNNLTIKKYWQLQAKKHIHSFDDTVACVRRILKQSIKNTLQTSMPFGVLLSGGLDSTIITLIAKKLKDNLQTYSVDYAGNSEHFKGNEFQVSRDNEFIELVRDRYNIKNTVVKLTNEQLIDSLTNSLIAKDYPGMVDVDGSLLEFSKRIKVDGINLVITGEGADEIFGGYPWFYREKFDKGFPWIRNADYRHNLLNENYKQKLNLKNYVQAKFDESVAEVPLYGGESEVDKQHKILTYLNMNWFMQTLLERTERMTMASAVEARLPFADINLVEYLYNVPWEFKFYSNMEKGLLRMATKDIVPDEILYRKKSPYPKTFNPEYMAAVKKLLQLAISKDSSILHELFDKKKLAELLKDDKDLLVPWFGQLMTKPQLIAYLYQLHLWFEKYNLNII